MDRDALFLLSMIALAVASIVVGVAGWVLWTRDHRAAKTADLPPAAEHPVAAEER
jgi:uncharacterized membrane protein